MTLPASTTTGTRIRVRPTDVALTAAAWVVFLLAMWWQGNWNFLFFHASIEIVSIVTAVVITVVAWTTRNYASNGFLVVLGAGMAPASTVLALHAFAYPGMGVLSPPLPAGDPNPALQLWVISRFLLAATLVAAPLHLRRRANMTLGLVLSSTVTAVAVLAVFWGSWFPTAYTAEGGLTAFKVGSEYLVIGMLALSGYLMWRRRNDANPSLVVHVLAAIACYIGAEIAFSQYTDVYGQVNLIGHLFALAAAILLLRGTFRVALIEPMSVVFNELSSNEARLARANRVLAMLSESRQAIAEAQTQYELLSAVCAAITELGDYRLAWIGMAVHDDQKTVSIVEVAGDASGYADDLAVEWGDTPRGHGPAGTAIRTGEPVVSHDTLAEPSFEPWREAAERYGIRSNAAIPIDVSGERFGVLCLYTAEPGRFEDEELVLVLQLASSIGNGIEALRLRAEREWMLQLAEEQRRQLELQVVERTAELSAAVADLEEASKVKDQFMRNMSHELRTPLNSIIGFSDLMLQGLAGPLNDEQMKQMRMLNASGRHLLMLVSELLDLARIEAGAVELEVAPVDVAALVDSVTGPLRVLAEQNGLALIAKAPSGRIVINTDEAKLRQILLNLIGNAIKFTEQGLVTVTVDDSGEGVIAFSITDTGCGIAESDIERVTEQFYQAPRPTGIKAGGTGLGLSIAKQLAELLGGALSIESVLGEGSTFTVTVARDLHTERGRRSGDDPAQ